MWFVIRFINRAADGVPVILHDLNPDQSPSRTVRHHARHINRYISRVKQHFFVGVVIGEAQPNKGGCGPDPVLCWRLWSREPTRWWKVQTSFLAGLISMLNPGGTRLVKQTEEDTSGHFSRNCPSKTESTLNRAVLGTFTVKFSGVAMW